MTFLEFLNDDNEFLCDIIVAGQETDCSVVWERNDRITEEGIKRFNKVLNSKIRFLMNGDIEILSNSYSLGNELICAMAGNCKESNYDKWFKKEA